MADDPHVYEVSKRFAIEGLSQAKIARQLKISRRRVAECLQFAHANDLIRVVSPANATLAEKLKQHLGNLCPRHLMVQGHGEHGPALAAAHFFEKEARDRDAIVLDGGKTICSMIDFLGSAPLPNIRVCPLVADLPVIPNSAYSATRRMREKYSTKSDEVGPPHSVKRHKLKTIYHQAQEFAMSAKWLFLGTGPFKEGFTAYEILDSIGLELSEVLKGASIEGLVGYMAITTGGVVRKLADDLIYCLTAEQIRAKCEGANEHVVLLASGEKKLGPVMAILRSPALCNTLCIDEELCKALLDTNPNQALS